MPLERRAGIDQAGFAFDAESLGYVFNARRGNVFHGQEPTDSLKDLQLYEQYNLRLRRARDGGRPLLLLVARAEESVQIFRCQTFRELGIEEPRHGSQCSWVDIHYDIPNVVKGWCAVFMRRLGHRRSTDHDSRLRFTPDKK
jgi:hypothetical protein